MITTATALSFEEDGSVVVDLTDDVEDVRRYPDHRMPPGPATRVIVNESDIVVPPNHDTNYGTSSSYPPKRTRNQRWLPVVLGMAVLLSFVLGIYFFLQSKQKSTSTLNNESVENPTPITEEELALHSDATNDCWILIDDTVYDVTQYAPKHPGGPEYITDFCGSNATKDFYINHPKEFLNIYLSSDTRKGVLSTNSNTTKTTTGGNSSKNNSNNASTKNNSTTTSNGENEKDKSGNDNEDRESENEVEDNDDDKDDDSGDDDSTWAPTTVPIDAVDAPTGVTTSPPATASCISIDEVALHSSSTDCYYILYDFVYDFTNYIDLHPGGARKVFQECGTDATAVFITEKFHNEDLLLEVNALDLYGLGYAC